MSDLDDFTGDTEIAAAMREVYRLRRENGTLREALDTILTYIMPYEYARRAGADIVFPEADVAAIARCARAALHAATAPAAPGE